MLRRSLRKPARAQPRSRVLHSSAVGLIHFPTLTIPPPTEGRKPDFRTFRLETPAPPTEAAAPTKQLLAELEVADFAKRRFIVVGITHDQAARNALRWAYRRAVADDATLVVVTAFEPPCPALTIYGWALIDARDAAAAAKFVQENVLRDELRSEDRETPVRALITRGDPAKVLVETAQGAEFLVIGRRAGRLRRFVSRSISRSCVSHADCPVVVLRGDVSVRVRSRSTRREIVAPVETARGESTADRAGHHQKLARAHPQFEFRRHAR